MKLVSLENITKYNELLNQKMVKSVNSVKPDVNGNVTISSLIPNQIIQSPVPLTDANLHLLDGALLSGDGAYADYVAMMGELYNADPTATCWTTESDWQTSLTTYGECGKFVYDSESNTLRLPKLTSFVQATNSANELGSLVEAGLPNITGQLYPTTLNEQGSDGYILTCSAYGAFSPALSKYNVFKIPTPEYVPDKDAGVDFNASRSNPIYGNSTTVQPQAIKYYFYIVVGTLSKTDIQVNIDNVMTDLNGKADKDLSNVSGIVRSVNGVNADASGNVSITSVIHATTADSATTALKLETYKQGSTTETYGASYPVFAQWKDGTNVALKCTGYTVWADKATTADSATTATNADSATNATNATKAIQDKNGAQIDTTYFKSANGRFTGQEYYRNSDEGQLRFNGGNTHDGGASLMLYAKNAGSASGYFNLVASTKEDASDAKQFTGRPDGSLTWNGKNIVRSVNGALADGNGNVEVISHTIQNTNNFASTFLHNNNALKIQCVRISGNQGHQFGTINWLVPFTDTNYHVFATSEDPDENLNFQLADVTFAGKTTTSCKVGHKVESEDVFYNGGFISVLGIGF